MKKTALAFLLTSFASFCFCQGIKVSLDTVHYATFNSFEQKDYVIIKIENNSYDDYVFWIAECMDGLQSDETKKHKFFFHNCGKREYNLFRYFTDNGNVNYTMYYLGFSFIKVITSKNYFLLVSSIENVKEYLNRFVFMTTSDFEEGFILLKKEWLYKYDILVLDNLEPVKDIE